MEEIQKQYQKLISIIDEQLLTLIDHDKRMELIIKREIYKIILDFILQLGNLMKIEMLNQEKEGRKSNEQ